MFRRFTIAVSCLFPMLLLLPYQSLAIPKTEDLHGAVAQNYTQEVTFFSFIELVSNGLRQARSVFPLANVFLVDAKPSFGTQSSNPSDFGNIELRLDDGGGTEITTRTYQSATQPRWTQPERGHRLPRTYIKRYNWEDVEVDLDTAFYIARISSYRGPWASVQVFKYTDDAFYAPGQIYYRLTEPGLLDSILFGLTTLSIYRQPFQNQHEHPDGRQQANASAVQTWK